jgi:hypothetical protein
VEAAVVAEGALSMQAVAAVVEGTIEVDPSSFCRWNE